MEIVIIVIFILVIIGFLFAIKYHRKEFKNNTWVHAKTGNKYSILLRCKMKCDGGWTEGVIYHRLGNMDSIYVKEFGDFVVNFVTLEEWERDNGEDSR